MGIDGSGRLAMAGGAFYVLARKRRKPAFDSRAFRHYSDRGLSGGPSVREKG